MQGEYSYRNGDKFTGRFERGKRCGQGTMTYKRMPGETTCAGNALFAGSQGGTPRTHSRRYPHHGSHARYTRATAARHVNCGHTSSLRERTVQQQCNSSCDAGRQPRCFHVESSRRTVLFRGAGPSAGSTYVSVGGGSLDTCSRTLLVMPVRGFTPRTARPGRCSLKLWRASGRAAAYVGEWRLDKYHGRGIFTHAGGDKVEDAMWVDGNRRANPLEPLWWDDRCFICESELSPTGEEKVRACEDVLGRAVNTASERHH